MYSAVYRSRSGDTIVIRRSITPPAKVRHFQGAGTALKRYKLVQFKQATREVCIVAKSTKTKKNAKSKEIEDTELEELEALEDLDDLDDEDEDEEDEEDEDVEEDEDEDDDDLDEDDDEEEESAPKTKKKSKATTAQKANLKKAQAAKKKKAEEREGVGSAEVAEHFGTDARTLRMVLRKHKVPKDEESGQYRWSSFNHPTVKKIGKWIKDGEDKAVKTEGFEKLKAKKAAEKKSSSKKSGKKSSKKSKKVTDEDDE